MKPGIFLRSLLPLIAIFALSLYALLAWADGDDAADALGCVIDDITGNYRCVSGPLEGREFLNAEEARAFLRAEDEKKSKDKEDEAFAASINVPLKFMSWNFTGVGTKRFEYDRIAAVLADADFAVLQEVEFSPTGESALPVIAGILSEKTKQRICKGWFKSNSGARGRHAFIWKDRAVAFVEKNGAVTDRCPDAPTVIRIDGKKIDAGDALTATFYLKSRRQMFTATAVTLEKKPKKAKELTAIFTKLSRSPWPILVAGTFKTAASDKMFKDALKLDFKPAFSRRETNVWTRSLNVVQADSVDLKSRFPDFGEVIAETPLFADVSFSQDEAETLRTQLVKKNQRAAEAAARNRKTGPREKPKAKPMQVHDDLESEAED